MQHFLFSTLDQVNLYIIIKKKIIFFLGIGIFFFNWEKNNQICIGNGAEFRTRGIGRKKPDTAPTVFTVVFDYLVLW